MVAKFNSSGTLSWARNWSYSGGESFGRSVTVDSSDNIYIGGYASTGTGNRAYALKFNSSGTIQWQNITATTSTDIRKVGMDASNNFWFEHSVSGNKSIVYVKANSSGTVQFSGSIAATTRYFYQGVENAGNQMFSASGNRIVLGSDGYGLRNYAITMPADSAYVKSVSGASETFTFATASFSWSSGPMTITSYTPTNNSFLTSEASTLTDSATSLTYTRLGI